MLESGGGNLACYPIATVSEGPGPRVGHAALLVGNAFIVFGGDTKMDDSDVLDDTLYLLNTCKSPVVPRGVSIFSNLWKPPDNGPAHHHLDPDHQDDMAIRSISWVLKSTSSEAKSKDTFSMT